MFFCKECMSFVLSWSAHQQHDDAVPGGTWCRHLGRSPDTDPWSFRWNQWKMTKSKIPLTINMQIHENYQAPAISFVYVFNKLNEVAVAWFAKHGFACEGSVRLNGLSFVFQCPCIHAWLFVICLLVHTFVWIHVNVNVRMHNNQRNIGKLTHQHGKIEWLTKLGSFCNFSIVTLPHISKHCASM